jgi:hypothetical protein
MVMANIPTMRNKKGREWEMTKKAAITEAKYRAALYNQAFYVKEGNFGYEVWQGNCTWDNAIYQAY